MATRFSGKPSGKEIKTSKGLFYVRPLTIGSLLDSKTLRNKNTTIEQLAKEAISLTTRDYTGKPLDGSQLKFLNDQDIRLITYTILEGEAVEFDKNKDGLYTLGNHLRNQIYSLNDRSNKIAKTLTKPLISEKSYAVVGDSIKKIKDEVRAMNAHGVGPDNIKAAKYAGSYHYQRIIGSSPPVVRAPRISHSQRAADAAEESSARLIDLTAHIKNLATELGTLSVGIGATYQELTGNAQKQHDKDQEAIARDKVNLKWAIGTLFVSAVLTIVQISIDLYRDTESAKHDIVVDERNAAQLGTMQDIRNALAPMPEMPAPKFTPGIQTPVDRFEARH